MISLHIDGVSAVDILAELKALAAGFSRETDDRLIARMHESSSLTTEQHVAAAMEHAQAAFPLSDAAAIAGTDDDAQIQLPLGDEPKTRKPRRTRAQIEADNAARALGDETTAETTQPEVVNNTGSAQPLTSPGADGAGAGEIVDAGRGTPSPVAEISPEAFRAKLQEAFTTDDGLRHLGSLLQEFGYERVKNVEAKDYAAIMARADQLVADRAAA